MVDGITIFFIQVCDALAGPLPCGFLPVYREEQGGGFDAEKYTSPGRL